MCCNTLGTAFSFRAHQVSVPSDKAGDFWCNSAPRWNPWRCKELSQPSGSKEKPPRLLCFISFSKYFRQFLLGLFKICIIGIFTSLWKALDILNYISSLESDGNFQLNFNRQLGIFTRASSSLFPASPLWMCMPLYWEWMTNCCLDWELFRACPWEESFGSADPLPCSFTFHFV